jgi:hypothetical protein
MRLTAILLVGLLLIAALTGFAQPKTRKLPAPLNHPSKNAFAPFMSLDGQTLLMASDYTEDDNLGVFYSNRETGSWTEPAQLPRTMTAATLVKGYTLSADGRTIYLTSAASRGIGGYDIVVTRKIPGGWAPAENFGRPVNSTLHDGAPTFTPDGKTVFFMRCRTMDTRRADGCSIFMARLSGTQWSDPEALPASVNTGNSQFPRILADSETLIYSSNKNTPGKTDYDLFQTRFVNGSWSAPAPLVFANTTRDDQFVSVNGIGQYLILDQPTKGKNELVEFAFPPELAPRTMQRISGRVTSRGKPAQAYITAAVLGAADRRTLVSPNEQGEYFVYLKGGERYELVFEPASDELLYYAKRVNLDVPGFQPLERLDVALEPLNANTSFFLDNLSFKPHSDMLAEPFDDELRRMARVIQASPDLKFDFRVILNRYREDSVQRDDDLTEVRLDSTWVRITLQRDSVSSADSLTVIPDSLTIIQYDTLILRKTYHNDRTLRQARSVTEALLKKGVAPEQLAWEGRRASGGDPALPEIRIEVAVLRKDQ